MPAHDEPRIHDQGPLVPGLTENTNPVYNRNNLDPSVGTDMTSLMTNVWKRCIRISNDVGKVLRQKIWDTPTRADFLVVSVKEARLSKCP